MRTPITVLFPAIALLFTCSAFAGTDADLGSIRGAVTDTTDGVLPGVTVVATSATGQPLATTTTDESGAYLFKSLPAGSVRLEFTLDGFSTETVQVSVQAGTETRVIRRLGLAPRSETVTVVGRIPEPPSLLQRVIYHYWYHNGENCAIRQMLGHTNLPQFVGNIDEEAPYLPHLA